MTTTGKRVRRIDDDNLCPTTGVVVGREDEDRVRVLWGDASWQHVPSSPAAYDHSDVRVEYLDELTPCAVSS